MRIGLFSSGYKRYPLEKVFQDAKAFGYDYIELWGGRPHAYPYDMDEKTIAETLELVEKYQKPIEVYTPELNEYPYNFMVEDDKMKKDAIGYVKQAVWVGKQLKAKYVLISAGHGGNWRSYEDLNNQMIDSLTEIAGYAGQCKQHLILEALTPFESNICNRAEEINYYIEKIKSPYLHGMCDVVPAFVQHQPIEDYFFHLKSELRHFHLVDSDGVSDMHILPGDGKIPLVQLAAMLKGKNYQNSLTIELVSAYINEPSLYAGLAIERLKELGY